MFDVPGASLEMAQGMLDDVDGQHDVRDGQITLQEFKRQHRVDTLLVGVNSMMSNESLDSFKEYLV